MSELAVNLRSLAATFGICAALILGLLLAHPHPHEPLHTFSDIVDFEISHQTVDWIVHGSMIAILIILLAAHILLLRLMSRLDLVATLAVATFGLACALMTASLVLDGFVTPMLAVQYRAASEASLRLATQAQITFCGACIQTLMPMALLSFAGAALAWARPLMSLGRAGLLAGIIGVVIGALVAIMLLIAPRHAINHVLMVGLLLLALWQFVLAVAVLKLRPLVVARAE
jgi:hypothetical protein